jgi:hypothetical protein
VPRKVFVAGEILTAADVNTNLMDQAVQRFADSTARGSAIPSPTEGMTSYLDDLNRIEVYNGSAWGAVGTILQVVQGVKTDTFTATLASGASTTVTGFEAKITPSSASSKVLVSFFVSGSANVSGWVLTVRRNGSAIGVGDSGGTVSATSGGPIGEAAGVGTLPGVSATSLLDSPATVSEVTYDCNITNIRGASDTLWVNRSPTDFARVSSRIILMEVAG